MMGILTTTTMTQFLIKATADTTDHDTSHRMVEFAQISLNLNLSGCIK